MEIRKLYPNGKKKALTFSYDDGVLQDVRLVEILNKYGLKGTFNLNSGIFGVGMVFANGNLVTRLPADYDYRKLYCGHEVAVHGVNHPEHAKLSYEQNYREIVDDQKALTELMGYPIRGMAYAFGSYNDDCIKIEREAGIRYARIVGDSLGFGLPDEPLKLCATCHHSCKSMDELLSRFSSTDDELALFYIWGHSYEFDEADTWGNMDNICAKAAGRDDTWYATNIDIIDYIDASKLLTVDQNTVSNHSDLTLWFEVDGKVQKLAANESKTF